MGFLVPAFLAGLAALGIPLLMHLRDRNEETPTRFPSLMFLVRLPIRTSDRRKVTDWPLLLLRALAVALLVFAFSRPFVGNTAEMTADSRAQRVVIALDRSLSMGHGDTWAAAQDSARAVLDALGGDDQVALVLFDEEATIAQTWTRDRASVRALIEATRPVARGTGFGAALRVARSALISAPAGAPSITLITDLQRSGLTGVAGLELPAGLPLRTIVVGGDTRPNTSLRSVEARRVVSGERVQLQVQARVVTRDLAAGRPVTLSLRLAGRDAGTRTATLPASGELTVAFDAVPAPATVVDGVVSISGDALAADDTLRFTLPADDALTVLLVAADEVPREETLYFERALGIGRAPAVRVERRRPGTVDAAALSRAALVVFWDAAPPTGAAAAALGTWQANGGGVAVIVGPRLAERRSVVANVATPTGLADRRTAGGALLGEIRDEHPLFAPFRSTQAALVAPRFYRYARLDPAVGADVLARFDDGSPAILESRAGEGRTLLIALSPDARESDFPLQPAFLPLMRRVVLHGAGHESTPLWRRTGESWVPQAIRQDPVIAAPDGDLLRPGAGAGASRAAVILEQVGVYGAYEGRVEGAPRDRVAVNVGPAESDLTPADPTELLLGVGESTDSTFRGVTAATSIELESRQRLWRWLLAFVALLLLAETVIASQGWRGRARRATIVSPERSQA